MLKKYLINELGSEKSYLFLEMQIAVILAIIVSVFYALLHGYLFLLQIIPLAVFAKASIALKKAYSRDFPAYFLVMAVLLLIVLLAPFAFQQVPINAKTPAEVLRYLTYGVFLVLLTLILARSVLLKKETRGKVILADRRNAVVAVDFDFLAGINAGKYVVENSGAKKGDFVRVSIKKGFFTGSRLNKVIGKVRK
jgi:uncharacterized membrane protein